MREASTESRDRIAHSYMKCADIVRARARNFYYGLCLTPEPKRSAIYSVYAWMRQADDEADRAGDPAGKMARLADFRQRTEQTVARAFSPCGLHRAEPVPTNAGPTTADRADFVWTALAETIRRFHIDPAHLRSMLDALETDIEHESRAAARADGKPILICRTREELERYCYRVASTVGLVCLTIWGLKPGTDAEAARRLAVQRGLAFQLTNILRDYAEDFDEGRVYLAAEDFQAARLSPDELRNWSAPPACEAMVSDIAAWARRQYTESAPLDRMIDPSCYATLRTMTRIYSGLLGVIENHPSRIAGRKRIRLQSMHKAAIALRACARAWVNQHIPTTSPLYAVLTPAARR